MAQASNLKLKAIRDVIIGIISDDSYFQSLLADTQHKNRNTEKGNILVDKHDYESKIFISRAVNLSVHYKIFEDYEPYQHLKISNKLPMPTTAFIFCDIVIQNQDPQTAYEILEGLKQSVLLTLAGNLSLDNTVREWRFLRTRPLVFSEKTSNSFYTEACRIMIEVKFDMDLVKFN